MWNLPQPITRTVGPFSYLIQITGCHSKVSDIKGLKEKNMEYINREVLKFQYLHSSFRFH